MGTYVGAAAQDSERLAADRAWVRWGVAAAVTGMLAWVIGFALIPLDAKLDKGDQHLVQVLRAHTGQGYAAALLAVLGAVLLAAFFAVLTRLVPEGHPGWGLVRVSLAGCVITQTMVAVGVSSGLAGLHAAAGNAGAGLAALGWRGLWLTFLASGVPTIVFTVTGVLGLRQAGLSPPWVSALGWLSAAAHVLVLSTLAQRGAFAADGIIAGLVPLTTVIWILALAATLPRPRRAAAPAPPEPAGDQGAPKVMQLRNSPPSQDFADLLLSRETP
jgi:hypothetical protein